MEPILFVKSHNFKEFNLCTSRSKLLPQGQFRAYGQNRTGNRHVPRVPVPLSEAHIFRFTFSPLSPRRYRTFRNPIASILIMKKAARWAAFFLGAGLSLQNSALRCFP